MAAGNEPLIVPPEKLIDMPLAVDSSEARATASIKSCISELDASCMKF